MNSPYTFGRDGNRVPITQFGFSAQKEITLSANNTTANVALFTITGSVRVHSLQGVVTTVIGSNHTAAYWRLNDQTAQPAISLATGTTVSSAAVGSLLLRNSVAAVALTLDNASAGRVRDPVAATAPDVAMPFDVVQKTAGVLTQIEYVYTTTNTPTSGAIKFTANWLPLSDDGALVAA